MARFPCDACGQRFFGKAGYAYPSVYVGDDQFGDRMRLCSSCQTSYLDVLVEHMGEERDGICSWGGEPIEDGKPVSYVYCTVYSPRSERRDVGGAVCEDHVGAAAANMLVDVT